MSSNKDHFKQGTIRKLFQFGQDSCSHRNLMWLILRLFTIISNGIHGHWVHFTSEPLNELGPSRCCLWWEQGTPPPSPPWMDAKRVQTCLFPSNIPWELARRQLSVSRSEAFFSSSNPRS